MSALSRRAFLATTGLSAALLPLMPRASLGQATGQARRVIFIGVPNGHLDLWKPSGSGKNFSIKPGDESPLAPLAHHRERLLIVGGLKLQNGWDTTHIVSNDKGRDAGKIGGHAASPMMLTGALGTHGPSQPDGWKMTAGGPSADVHIANNMPGAENLRFKPLAMRATRKVGNRGFLSYQGAPLVAGEQNPTGLYSSPVQLYKDMFGDDQNLDATEKAKVLAGRRMVLDHTGQHLSAMHKHFGSENKARIEAHLEAVRRTTETLTSTNECKAQYEPPGNTDYEKSGHNPDYPQILKSQSELATLALACDMTRSVTLYWSDYANNNLSFPWLIDKDARFGGVSPADQQNGGQIRTHHNIAHHDQGKLKNYVDQWFIKQYAYLMDLLTASTDAEGRPLIETTVVVFANMQETGGNHRTDRLTWILGGNFDGYFNTGRYIPWASGTANEPVPHNRILTSIINGSGCPEIDYFGERDYGGELSGLKA